MQRRLPERGRHRADLRREQQRRGQPLVGDQLQVRQPGEPGGGLSVHQRSHHAQGAQQVL